MHDIRRFIPNLLPVLLLICICEFTACTHPVRRLVFQPHKIELVPPFPKDVTHLERFWLKTEQGDVEWWLFEGDGIDASHQRPAVLMAHGNRELIDFYLNRAESLFCCFSSNLVKLNFFAVKLRSINWLNLDCLRDASF
jgi:hypothetical protein